MTVRKASSGLQTVQPEPPLIEREPAASGPKWGALDWQGPVRLAADRAAGISAAQWQHHVRTGLLERALVLGADHREGPHRERPEAARRLLAHIDALAEAGLSPAGLEAFAAEAELDNPGALWVLTILFGCLDASGADEVFEAWVASLDASLFLTYEGIQEIAEALLVQPNPQLRSCARRWPARPAEVLCAIGLEVTTLAELPDDVLAGLGRIDSPIVQVAIERLFSRSPIPRGRLVWKPVSWIDLPVPALSFQVARTRILGRELQPLRLVREGDAQATGALGPYALDVLALAGDGRDQALAQELARGFPTTPKLLDAMGRVGLPALFPRLLAELESDDFDDDAHAALVTSLGPRVARPSVQAWEQAIGALPKAADATRLRGGEPHAVRSVLEEINRPDLSAQDVRARADELFAKTGKPAQVEWESFGMSLEGALSSLARAYR